MYLQVGFVFFSHSFATPLQSETKSTSLLCVHAARFQEISTSPDYKVVVIEGMVAVFGEILMLPSELEHV